MCIKWLKESNRGMHLLGGIALSLVFTFFCALGAAIGMEMKDCHYDKRNAGKYPWQWNYEHWDWIDFILTVVGGLVGGSINVFIVYNLIKLWL